MELTANELLTEAGYEDVVIFKDFSYDDALIGVSHDNRAIYDYDKMIEWLVTTEEWSYEEAAEWIDYNTIRSLGYYGSDAPIVMYPIYRLENDE